MSLQQTLRIGIVGMGTGGLASAIFIQRLGHHVTIFEKTSQNDLESPVGAGLGIQPIGLTVLKRLGILNDILSHGAKIEHLHSLTREGKTVLDLKYADFNDKLYGIGLHRDALFTSLYNQIYNNDENENINIVTNANVKNVEIVNGKKGSYISMDNGKKDGPYDLIIIADGRESIRKNMKHVKSYEKKYKYGCLWSIIPDKKNDFVNKKTLYQKLDSAKTMLGLLPTGTSPKQKNKELVSLFWSCKVSDFSSIKAKGLENWKEEVYRLEPKTFNLLNEIKNFNQLIEATYSDTYMPKLFDETTNTAFIGDCAHATSPQLGQGANLALVDAWVLSNAIQSSINNNNNSKTMSTSVHEALYKYNEERKWRLRFYQLNSRLLTPVFQSDSKTIGWLRDLTLGPLCYFPPTRLQMLTVLCGAQNNGIPWTTIPEEEYLGYTL